MSNSSMQKLDNVLERVCYVLLIISGVVILLMGLAVTFGVVMRYAFHAPEPYTYELSAMFLLLCGLFAFAGVEKLDRNVRNDLISSRYPPRVRVIILNVTFLLMALIFVAVLAWKSLGNASYALQIGQISASPWAVPLAPIKFMIPAAYFLLCLVLIVKIIQGFALLKGRKNQEELA